MNRALFLAAGLAGALAVAWVATGYLQGHPLALAMTLLIAAVYAAGVAELLRHQRATQGLYQAVAQLPAADDAAPAPGAEALADWLATVPALLRASVARRVKAGGRAPLPAPAMAPYLTGLLVLLGMLGTFAGMIVTLRGTGLALETAGDVATLRDSLAAPVRGLGLAFGASVAGVAASAALGLMAALARRSRNAAVQALDAHIAGTLLPHTRAHQQRQALDARQAEQAAALLQALQAQQTLAERLALRQAEQADRHAEQHLQQLPRVAATLQAVADQLQQHSAATHDTLLQRQRQFHADTAQQVQALAASVDDSLQRSLGAAAQQAAATLQTVVLPAVQAAMAGITRETSALHEAVRSAVQQQLDGLAARFERQIAAWVAAIGTQQQQQAQAVLQALGDTQAQQQARLAEAEAQRLARLQAVLGEMAAQLSARGEESAALLQALQQQQAEAQQRAAAADETRLAAHAAALQQMAQQLQQRMQQMTAEGEAQARGTMDEVARLVQSVETHAVEAPRAAAEVVAQLREQLSRSLAQDTALLEERSRTAAALGRLLGGVQQQLDGLTQSFERQSSTWVAAVGTQVQQHTGAMLQALQVQHEAALAAQHTQTAEADAQRLAQFTAALQQMAEQLQQRTGEMVARAETQARSTLAEVAQVVQAAGEAPRAAAEMAAQLREQFSQSLVRDNTRLAERDQLLASLQAVLAELQAGAGAQQQAVQALVAAGTRVLEDAGSRAQAQTEAEAARLQAVAAQLGASAVDVASLGDAFGAAAAQFAQGSEQMLAQLQRVEEALARTSTRSDEQLAYYVAQAREVIDLSLLSQKQIVDDLQRLAALREAASATAA